VPKTSKGRVSRVLIAGLSVLGIPVVAFAGLVVTIAAMYGPTYAYRVVSNGQPTILDYKNVFPSRTVENQAPAFHFKTTPRPIQIGQITYTYAGKTATIDFEPYLQKSQATSFVVIKDDTILYEKYLNGYTRESINRSFSMAKSVISTLVGLAVRDGYIHSINDTVITYIPELKGRGLDAMTIRDLMLMNSGLAYSQLENVFILFQPFHEDTLLYYHPDARRYVLNLRGGPDPIGEYFLYDNSYPYLEGLIIERTSRKTISAYTEEKLWKPLGMEFTASWSLDSEEDGQEQMSSGLNARTIDFAKFARLFLQNGTWNGRQLLPAGWVSEATSPDPDDRRPFRSQQAWQDMGGYYKYHWWGMRNRDGTYDYAALGSCGQVIYISPGNNTIVLRNGYKGDALEYAMIARSIIQLLK
jgi:CubicO group peptidase (beta-lactamase class C family)